MGCQTNNDVAKAGMFLSQFTKNICKTKSQADVIMCAVRARCKALSDNEHVAVAVDVSTLVHKFTGLFKADCPQDLMILNSDATNQAGESRTVLGCAGALVYGLDLEVGVNLGYLRGIISEYLYRRIVTPIRVAADNRGCVITAVLEGPAPDAKKETVGEARRGDREKAREKLMHSLKIINSAVTTETSYELLSSALKDFNGSISCFMAVFSRDIAKIISEELGDICHNCNANATPGDPTFDVEILRSPCEAEQHLVMLQSQGDRAHVILCRDGDYLSLGADFVVSLGGDKKSWYFAREEFIDNVKKADAPEQTDKIVKGWIPIIKAFGVSGTFVLVALLNAKMDYHQHSNLFTGTAQRIQKCITGWMSCFELELNLENFIQAVYDQRPKALASIDEQEIKELYRKHIEISLVNHFKQKSSLFNQLQSILCEAGLHMLKEDIISQVVHEAAYTNPNPHPYNALPIPPELRRDISHTFDWIQTATGPDGEGALRRTFPRFKPSDDQIPTAVQLHKHVKYSHAMGEKDVLESLRQTPQSGLTLVAKNEQRIASSQACWKLLDTLACYERDPNASQEMLKLSFENEPDWPPLDLKVIHNYYTQVTLRREKKSTQRALKDFRAYFLRDAGKIYLYGKVQSLKFNYYRDVFGEMTVTVDEDGQLVVDKVVKVEVLLDEAKPRKTKNPARDPLQGVHTLALLRHYHYISMGSSTEGESTWRKKSSKIMKDVKDTEKRPFASSTWDMLKSQKGEEQFFEFWPIPPTRCEEIIERGLRESAFGEPLREVAKYVMDTSKKASRLVQHFSPCTDEALEEHKRLFHHIVQPLWVSTNNASATTATTQDTGLNLEPECRPPKARVGRPPGSKTKHPSIPHKMETRSKTPPESEEQPHEVPKKGKRKASDRPRRSKRSTKTKPTKPDEQTKFRGTCACKLGSECVTKAPLHINGKLITQNRKNFLQFQQGSINWQRICNKVPMQDVTTQAKSRIINRCHFSARSFSDSVRERSSNWALVTSNFEVYPEPSPLNLVSDDGYSKEWNILATNCICFGKEMGDGGGDAQPSPCERELNDTNSIVLPTKVSKDGPKDGEVLKDDNQLRFQLLAILRPPFETTASDLPIKLVAGFKGTLRIDVRHLHPDCVEFKSGKCRLKETVLETCEGMETYVRRHPEFTHTQWSVDATTLAHTAMSKMSERDVRRALRGSVAVINEELSSGEKRGSRPSSRELHETPPNIREMIYEATTGFQQKLQQQEETLQQQDEMIQQQSDQIIALQRQIAELSQAPSQSVSPTSAHSRKESTPPLDPLLSPSLEDDVAENLQHLSDELSTSTQPGLGKELKELLFDIQQTIRSLGKSAEQKKILEELNSLQALVKQVGAGLAPKASCNDRFKALLSDDKSCKRLIGLSLGLFEKLFAYFNAEKDLDNMDISFKPQAPGRGWPPESKKGSKRKLSPRHCLALCLMLLRHGRLGLGIICISKAIGLSRQTITRYYESTLFVVVTIGLAHQTPPSTEFLGGLTTRTVAFELGVEKGTPVLIGDATERRAASIVPVLWSHYKQTHTLKSNMVVNILGGIVFLTLAYPGSVSDNKLHRYEEIAQSIGRVCEGCLLLYDKGLTDAVMFTNSGVVLKTPKMKQRGQINWTKEEVDTDRRISRNRVVVENVFGEIKQFRATVQPIQTQKARVADFEMQAARVLVNCLPRRALPQTDEQLRQKLSQVPQPMAATVATPTSAVLEPAQTNVISAKPKVRKKQKKLFYRQKGKRRSKSSS